MMLPIKFAAIVLVVTTSTQSAIAAGSGANPDVIGIKVGISSLADVRSTLSSVTPVLVMEELQAQLTGMTSQTRSPVQVANGKYVAEVRATTKAFKSGNSACAGPLKGNCEIIVVAFSAPPNPATAYYVVRDVLFEIGPSVDNLVRSLTEKYGRPGHVRNFGNQGAQYDLAWAWSTDGMPVPVNEQHPCFSVGTMDGRAGFGKQIELTQTYLKVGCGFALNVKIEVRNNVVVSMRQRSVDNASLHSWSLKTAGFVTSYVRSLEQGERDTAAKAATPKL